MTLFWTSRCTSADAVISSNFDSSLARTFIDRRSSASSDTQIAERYRPVKTKKEEGPYNKIFASPNGGYPAADIVADVVVRKRMNPDSSNHHIISYNRRVSKSFCHRPKGGPD